jgi:hypothetical protein
MVYTYHFNKRAFACLATPFSRLFALSLSLTGFFDLVVLGLNLRFSGFAAHHKIILTNDIGFDDSITTRNGLPSRPRELRLNWPVHVIDWLSMKKRTKNIVP